VRSGIIDDSFGAVLDEEFEKLQSLSLSQLMTLLIQRASHLIDLTPFFGGFVGEPLVNHRHYFVELLASEGQHCAAIDERYSLIVCSSRDLLHQSGGGTPGITVGGFTDLFVLALGFKVRCNVLTLASISVRFMTAATCQYYYLTMSIDLRTILNLPDAGLHIVQRQVADLSLETVKVHVSGLAQGLAREASEAATEEELGSRRC
jgi:hypothetical protein